MRLIDADALLKQIFETTNTEENARMLRLLTSLVKDAPTVDQWVSVKNRLPDRYKKVLTYGASYGVQENWLIRTGKEISWSMGYRITHWMPLPEPPKEQPLQRHGHWVRLPKFLVESQCSVCGETYVGDCRTFNFCPTCGAEMDGEVEVKQE